MRKHYPKKKLRLMFVVCMTLIFTLSQIVQGQPGLLDPGDQTKFTNPLPIPAQIDARGGGQFEMVMKQSVQDLGIVDGSDNPLNTTIWGYGPLKGVVTYPGPTFIAQKDVKLKIRWYNQLVDVSGNNLPHLLPVDPTMHMAHPPKPKGSMMTNQEWVRYWYNDLNNIPTVVHLHGGHTESASDGLPEAWFTQDFNERGPQFKKEQYIYHNDQEAATLWYHDHALGITRLNVNAGLAGFYLLRDANEDMLNSNGILPSGPYEIEIVIQDRMFTSDGQLFWPAFEGDPAYDDFITGEGAILPPEIFPENGGPTALAEFFGDFILVNGKAWPYLDVEPRKYRFRLLNGSDSRFYILKFTDNIEFLQIGTDNGLIENATLHNQLVIAPGERYDVVVDFGGKMGSNITLQNFGPDEPFKGLAAGQDPADPATTGSIMMFKVNQPLDPNVADATVSSGTSLRPAIVDHPTTGVPTRQLVLFEGTDEYGRLQPLLGTLDQGSLAWFEHITENPNLGATEIWEVYNATADAHPIHLHLVSFQVINRQSFTGTVEDKAQIQHNGSYGNGGLLTGVTLGGVITGPGTHENGWKDTFIVPPGQVGRVVAKFDREGRYVWHCHILSHEDHEMMRPFYVGNMPKMAGKSKHPEFDGYVLGEPFPNPISTGQLTEITMEVPKNLTGSYKIYNDDGMLIDSQIVNLNKGVNTITLPGSYFTANGIYLFTISIGEFYDFKQILVE